jgi:tRNA G18 (ribose-2'-O)-methylase SpoU
VASKAERRAAREQALARYERQRRLNLFAEPGINPVVCVLDHLKAGFNVPKIFRSAQAFGVYEVHLIGIGPFDPAPAKGAFKRVPARFYDHIDESLERLRELDCTPLRLEADAPAWLTETGLPERCGLIVGHEEFGFSFDAAEYPGIGAVSIPLVGALESLNVSIAASIAMYEWVRQHPARVE